MNQCLSIDDAQEMWTIHRLGKIIEQNELKTLKERMKEIWTKIIILT